MKHTNFRLWIALIALNLMNFAQTLEAATLAPASSPLANSTTTVVRPNIMYVLDDSGSMGQDYTPDYINDTTATAGSYAMCWGVNTGTNFILDTDQAAACPLGGSLMVNNATSGNDLAVATSDLNSQYYNPAIYYQPPVKANGTSYGNVSTTSALNDGYNAASGNINLTTAWKHQVWCDSAGGSPTALDPTSGGHCFENSNTSGNNLYPKSGFTFVKTYNAAPYYFTMSPFEYCTDSTGVSCISATSASGSNVVPFTNRWCASYNTFTNQFISCQARRDPTHAVPNFLGFVTDYSYGTITVTDAAAGKTITQITINGNSLLSGTATATAGNLNTTARTICTAINTGSSSGIYYARSGSAAAFNTRTCNTAVNGLVEIQRVTIDAVDNGQAIIVTGPAPVVAVAATGTLTINSTPGATRVNSITVGATSLLPAAQNFADGTAVNSIATTLAGLIGNGYTATAVGNVITVRSNVPGTAPNGSALALSASAVSATAAITVGSTGQVRGADLGGINVGPPSVGIVGHIGSGSLTNGTATTTNATTIKNAVGGGYTAACTGGAICTANVVTVTAPAGAAANGKTFTFVNGTAVAAIPAVFPTGLITFGGTTTSAVAAARINRDLAGSKTIDVGGITASNANPLTISASFSRTPTQVAAAVVASVGTGGTVKAYVGGNAITPTCAGQTTSVVCLVDTTPAIVNAKAVTVGTRTNFGGVTVATTPTAGGVVFVPGVDNFALFLTASGPFSGGRSAQLATGSSMGGGVNAVAGTIGTITTSMTNGSPTPVHNAVGIFMKTNIIPATASYPKVSGRTDCTTIAATCTYAEELQNFANWYSYYKTRILMMKSTSALSFSGLTGTDYNIGFDNISNCAGQPCATTVVQPVGQFIDTCSVACTAAGTCGGTGKCQRSLWWKKLVSTVPSSNTPNRAEVAKMGLYYAGKLSVTAANPDPIQYSCQQNFAFLVTDGYWNEGEAYAGGSSNILKIDGTNIDNTDNVATIAGLSNRPFYDGAMASTVCPAINTAGRGAASSCRNLSDITYYYYNTDLRQTAFGNVTNGVTDVSADNVPTTGTDNNQSQHMSFFAMALGIDGVLQYRADYANAASGDYADITAGTLNWPAVKNNDPTGIDDLWHAAVNGHGKYFSARDPASVNAGLKEALNSIKSRVGAGAAAATSNLQPVTNDNFAYVASYATVDWWGDLQERIVDVNSGAVSDPANPSPNECVNDTGCPWSAQKILDATAWDTARKVYVAPTVIAPATVPPTGAAPRSFTYTNLTATEQAYFNPATGNAIYGTTPLSQFATVSISDPADISASNMVDFLRGDRSMEQPVVAVRPAIWRSRLHVLGDIVDTQPAFVKAPSATYQDDGYGSFVTTNASRPTVVYASGNDGMLHAFITKDYPNSTAPTTLGGTELWAFIPTAGLPYLRNLADFNYVHRNYVDGQISVGDVDFGSPGTPDWHTILVGGLGGGGKSYYALDITDPFNPKYLWEFTDPNLGFTYGNATINRLPNGEWAVLFSSGYNNIPPTPADPKYATADGHGYLYAVNPQTGVIKTGYPLTTGAAYGSTASPSNLGKIAAWVDNVQFTNVVTYVYAGDMDGHLWRFDLDPSNSLHTGVSVFRLADLTDGATTPNPQPITTRPELTTIGSTRVIYVGTGQYLEPNDLTNTKVQSFYALKDTLGQDNIVAGGGGAQVSWNPRTVVGTASPVAGTPLFIQRLLLSTKNDGSTITKVNSSGATVPSRQICTGAGSQVSSATGKCINETGGPMDWTNYGGWYYDFPDAGERMNVDVNLTLGTLTIPTNVPASSACTAGGFGWLNFIDFKTGLAVTNTTLFVSEKINNALIVGVNVIITAGGGAKAIVTTSDNRHPTDDAALNLEKFSGKRDFWREFNPY